MWKGAAGQTRNHLMPTVLPGASLFLGDRYEFFLKAPFFSRRFWRLRHTQVLKKGEHCERHTRVLWSA